VFSHRNSFSVKLSTVYSFSYRRLRRLESVLVLGQAHLKIDILSSPCLVLLTKLGKFYTAENLSLLLEATCQVEKMFPSPLCLVCELNTFSRSLALSPPQNCDVVSCCEMWVCQCKVTYVECQYDYGNVQLLQNKWSSVKTHT
jgi:hypothetical protein